MKILLEKEKDFTSRWCGLRTLDNIGSTTTWTGNFVLNYKFYEFELCKELKMEINLTDLPWAFHEHLILVANKELMHFHHQYRIMLFLHLGVLCPMILQMSMADSWPAVF